MSSNKRKGKERKFLKIWLVSLSSPLIYFFQSLIPSHSLFRLYVFSLLLKPISQSPHFAMGFGTEVEPNSQDLKGGIREWKQMATLGLGDSHRENR